MYMSSSTSQIIFVILYKYIASYLSYYSNSYSARCSQSVGDFLDVPTFHPSTQKSVKQFPCSFAFDASIVGMLFPMHFT